MLNNKDENFMQLNMNIKKEKQNLQTLSETENLKNRRLLELFSVNTYL